MELVKKLEENPYRFGFWIILVTGCIFRLIVALNGYGQKHPDEVYQSLEIAHDLVFGSGHYAPEFQSSFSPPSYAASRSWLFPLMFAGIMWVGKVLGLNYFTVVLPMIKIFLALNATLLLPATYKLVQQLTKSKTSALFSMFAVAFWFRIIEYTVRSFTNTFYLPYIFYGIYLVLKMMEDQEITIMRVFLISASLGLSTYIRIDLGILVFAFFLATLKINYNRIKLYLILIGGSAIFWIIGASIDYYMYDGAKFFSVIINWYTFNVVKEFSRLFGVSPYYFYFVRYFIGDFLFLSYIPIIFLIKDLPTLDDHILDSIKHQLHGIKILGLSTIFSLIIYSYPIPEFDFNNGISIYIVQSHKEVRFIIGVICLFAMLAGVIIEVFVHTHAFEVEDNNLDNEFNPPKFNQRKFMVIGILFILLFLSLSNFAASHRMHPDWHEDNNRALIFIGSQDNVEKVLIYETWFYTGGYSYSHLPEDVEIKFGSGYASYPDSEFGKTVKIPTDFQRANDSTYVMVQMDTVGENAPVFFYLNSYNFTKLQSFGSAQVWRG